MLQNEGCGGSCGECGGGVEGGRVEGGRVEGVGVEAKGGRVVWCGANGR